MFGKNLLLLELIISNRAKPAVISEQRDKPSKKYYVKTFEKHLSTANDKIKYLYQSMRDYHYGIGRRHHREPAKALRYVQENQDLCLRGGLSKARLDACAT